MSRSTSRTRKAGGGNGRAMGPVLLLPVAFSIFDEDAPSPKSAETAAVRPGVDRRQSHLLVVPERHEISCSPEQFHFIRRTSGAVSQRAECLGLLGRDQIVQLEASEGALQPKPFQMARGAIRQYFSEGRVVRFGHRNARFGFGFPREP